MVNSRAKGARIEREAAAKLRELGHQNARRGQQFRGGPESPDVADAIPYVHIEVKGVERLNIWEALTQAERDSTRMATPCLLFKRNRTPFFLAVQVEYMTELAIQWLRSVGYNVEGHGERFTSPKTTLSPDMEG